LAFFSLAIASVISIILSLSSAYYQAIAIPVALMGVLGVIVSIITAISAKKAHFIENKLKERKSFFLMWALLLISVFFMAIMFKYIGFIFLMFIPFVDGFFGVVIDSYANDYIGTSHRTTLLSVKNMFNNIGIFILFPIVGYLTKAFSLQFALLSMGAFFLLYSVFLYILYKKLGLKIK
jgi:MFS family permease